MNIIYTIIVYTFLVNVAAGILTSPTITGWEVDFQDKVKSYEELNQSASGIAKNPVENPEADPSGFSLFDNIFGIVTFGWYDVIMDFIKQYLYGMVGILLSIIPFEDEVREVIQNYLYLGLSILYGFGLVAFITGKVFN